MDPTLTMIKLLCFLSSMFPEYREHCDYKQAINLSNYQYPTPSNETEGIYRVAILGTNDIHGAAFPFRYVHPIDNTEYDYGGLQYLANYIRIMRGEWGDRFLWLDGGDQFQGKIESKISNGDIIKEFFTTVMVNASSIGNHEWDYGQPFLYEKLEKSNWNYLAANVLNNEQKTEFLPNSKVAKIFTMGEVKVGVIGLSTIQTPFTTSGDLTNVKFAEYRDIVINLSKSLRESGANAVVIMSHVGMKCPNDSVDKMILKVRQPSTSQGVCDNDEMKVLLESLEPGVVDAVVAGHVHDVAHHWINGVPVVQSKDGGYFSNIIYLAFDSKTKKILKDKIEIEGPLPTCRQVFENNLNCNYLTKTSAASAGSLRNFIFHNKFMKADQSLNDLFNKWWKETQSYKVRVTSTDTILKRGRTEENALGNLISDIYKQVAGADVSIINDGSMRSEWVPGDIFVEDVYNMFPFDNYLVTIEMTGLQLKQALSLVQSGSKSFYHTSGLSQLVSTNPNKLVSVKLYDGTEIDEEKVYVVATNDFLAGGGDDFRLVREWYTPVNQKSYGLLRNIIIEELEKIKELKLEDLIISNKRRLQKV